MITNAAALSVMKVKAADMGIELLPSINNEGLHEKSDKMEKYRHHAGGYSFFSYIFVRNLDIKHEYYKI